MSRWCMDVMQVFPKLYYRYFITHVKCVISSRIDAYHIKACFWILLCRYVHVWCYLPKDGCLSCGLFPNRMAPLYACDVSFDESLMHDSSLFLAPTHVFQMLSFALIPSTIWRPFKWCWHCNFSHFVISLCYWSLRHQSYAVITLSTNIWCKVQVLR